MNSPVLPIDLDQLVDFLYTQEIAKKWIFSTMNKFFATAIASDGVESVVISEDPEGSWNVLPASWREYFENDQFGPGGRGELLEDLASARDIQRVRTSPL